MMRAFAVISFAAAASGCASDDYQRIDGMTPGAGNAIAANTVMQLVDPWQPGVEDTQLRVPADRGAEKATGGNALSAGGAASGGTSANK